MPYSKVYVGEHEGHTLAFWPVCSLRTLWLASINYLLVDGRVAATSGGFVFRSAAKSSLSKGNECIPVEVRSTTSKRGLFHLDFKVLIGGDTAAAGTLRMSFRWTIPSNIEEAVAQQAGGLRR
jgi:hypothetical protein